MSIVRGYRLVVSLLIVHVVIGFLKDEAMFYKGNTTLGQLKKNFVLDVPYPFIPFHGRLYEKIYISRDGMVGFTPGIHYTESVYSSRDDLQELATDAPFIAVFRFQSSENSGDVYLRVLNNTDTETEWFGRYIQNSVLGMNHFQPSWIMIVTWLSMEYFGKQNTFQLVLLTDHAYTVAIMNYDDMNIPAKKTFQAGFNGGYGQGWTEVMHFDKVKLAHRNTGSDVRGRYMYKVDDSFVVRGGCHNYRHIFGALVVYPTFADMLGGQLLNVSGPCLTPRDKIVCKFGHDEALAIKSSGVVLSTTRASCPVPKLLQRGRVKISLSTDHGESYYYSTIIYIVHPLDSLPRVHTLLSEADLLLVRTISITWNMHDLSQHRDALVDVQLIAYYENTNWGMWNIITDVGRNIPVSLEQHTFTASDYPCIGSDCTLFDVGFLEVKLQNSSLANHRRSLNSKIMPLVWFRNHVMTGLHGDDWPTYKCNEWYEKDKESIRWFREISECPCTVQQALVDISRWTASRHCNMFGDGACMDHKGAVHCVESIQKSFFDAANTCCYSEDGLLMTTVDYSYGGSLPSRSDIAGTPPYINNGIVPYMSYLLSDEVPMKYCCEWSKSNVCYKFTKMRPTADCRSYIPNKIASLYGQGHFRTFEGHSDKICSTGDYVLVEAPGVIIQGRFQKNIFNPKADQSANESVTLTSIGIQTDGEKIEVRLKTKQEIRKKRNLDIKVNGEYILLGDRSVFRHDLSKSIIFNTNNKRPDNQDEASSNISVVLKNGMGVQIESVYHRLFVLIHIPEKFKEMVNGLLGKLTDNTSHNEVKMRSNSMWRIQQRRQHNILGTSLRIEHEVCRHQDIKSDVDLSFCDNDKDCVYDYLSTKNKTIAVSTRAMKLRDRTTRKYAMRVPSCSPFDLKNSEKNSKNYTVGSTITVTGCREGFLINAGEHIYTCVSESKTQQSWSPPIHTVCTSKQEVTSTIYSMLGFTISIICAIWMSGFVVAVIIIKRRKISIRSLLKI